MAHTLTLFGRYCRDARALRGKTMAAQADALGHSISQISLIETGKRVPSDTYVDQLCAWLLLGPQQQGELRRRVPRSENVVDFPRRREVDRTVRLFRKVGRMTPAQIRALGMDGRGGAPDG